MQESLDCLKLHCTPLELQFGNSSCFVGIVFLFKLISFFRFCAGTFLVLVIFVANVIWPLVASSQQWKPFRVSCDMKFVAPLHRHWFYPCDKRRYIYFLTMLYAVAFNDWMLCGSTWDFILEENGFLGPWASGFMT